jgi:hypothetical protein
VRLGGNSVGRFGSSLLQASAFRYCRLECLSAPRAIGAGKNACHSGEADEKDRDGTAEGRNPSPILVSNPHFFANRPSPKSRSAEARRSCDNWFDRGEIPLTVEINRPATVLKVC